MSELSFNNVKPKSSQFMLIFGTIILLGVGLYFVFMGFDSLGLKKQEDTALVIGKSYHKAGKTYTTKRVGDRMLTIPRILPGKYILQLKIGNIETECPVDKDLYNSVNIEDIVCVVYKKSRILGSLQIVNVTHY